MIQRLKNEDTTRPRSPSPLNLITTVNLQESLNELDEIVKMPDLNYFATNFETKKLNIFSVMHMQKDDPRIARGI